MLEKVQAGIRQSSPKPVHVPAKRTTRLDCLRCLYAFSTDGLLSRPFDQLPAEQKFAISGSPTRLRECYGWTRVRGADFLALNDSIEVQEDVDSSDGEVSASLLEADREYFALVYEYIPKAGLEFDAVQRQLDFFYHIGFQHCQVPDQRNWQGPGILLDFGDYHSPVDQWFHGGDAFTTCPLAAALLDWDGYMAKLSKKTTKEEVRAGKKFEARGKTARYVESGYDGELWSVSYFKRKFKLATLLYASTDYYVSQQSLQKKSWKRSLRKTTLPPSISRLLSQRQCERRGDSTNGPRRNTLQRAKGPAAHLWKALQSLRKLENQPLVLGIRAVPWAEGGWAYWVWK